MKDRRGKRKKEVIRKKRNGMKKTYGRVKMKKKERTRPDTRHKMRLVCVLSPSTITRDRRTDGRTDGRTDRRAN